jgi:hypothetical protein
LQCMPRRMGARYERQPSRLEMKKLLITGIAVLLAISAAYAADEELPPVAAPPVQATPIPPAPPLGWVYGPYTMCGDPPRCSMGVVNVPADGLNVRIAPNGPPVMSLVNGTPLCLLKGLDYCLALRAKNTRQH